MSARGTPTVPIMVVFLAVLLLGPLAPATPAPPEYTVTGSAHIHGETVLDRERWDSTAYGEALLRHHLRFAGAAGAAPPEVVLDHGVLIWPAPNSAPGTGLAGAGTEAPADVAVVHEVYAAYLHLPLGPHAAATVGRQFAWGHPRVTGPAGLRFSVTDGLHPRAALPVMQPGFDGLRVELGSSGPAGLAVAVALQDVFAEAGTEPDGRDHGWERTRFAAQGWIVGPGDRQFGAGVMWQDAVMLRPGLFLVVPGESWRLGAELALEGYDPRAQVIRAAVLGGIRAEYTAPIAREGWLEVGGEYHYNGLAAVLDNTAIGATPPVTSDGAGGFLRVGEHYLSLDLSLEFARWWRTGHVVTTNLGDGSLLADHELVVLRWAPVELGAGLVWQRGTTTSEFGGIREDLLVRLSAGYRW